MDAVDQIVNYSFKGGEVALRIVGAGVKNLALYIAALLQDTRKISGRTRMSRMAKEGKDQVIYTLDRESLKLFAEQARKYGILYAVAHDVNSPTADIIVRASDAEKVNYIHEKCNLGKVKEIGKIIMEEINPDINPDKTVTEPEPSENEMKIEALTKKYDDLYSLVGEMRYAENKLQDAQEAPAQYSEHDLAVMNEDILQHKDALKDAYNMDAIAAVDHLAEMEKTISEADAEFEKAQEKQNKENPTQGQDYQSQSNYETPARTGEKGRTSVKKLLQEAHVTTLKKKQSDIAPEVLNEKQQSVKERE